MLAPVQTAVRIKDAPLQTAQNRSLSGSKVWMVGSAPVTLPHRLEASDRF